MAETERLDEQSLQALLGEEIRAAVTYDSEELSSKRAKAIEYYNGTMTDTPAATGRSSVVSLDVADTIGWMLPGIVRVFTASGTMAEYEPVGKGDEDGAKQATEYANYVFWKDNDGERIIWDATHDSLLQADGIIKHWWDESEDCEYSEHSGLTAEQIALLEQDGAEVVSQDQGEPQQVMVPGPDGMPVPQSIETWNVKVKRVTKGRLLIDCIEPENFLKNREAIRIEDARFVSHRDEKTRSDLIEMGFPKDVVDQLPAYSPRSDSEETIARDTGSFGTLVGHRSTELIELYECYVKADVNGDGISETIRAYYAGKGGAGTLLDWEEWEDDLPFSIIPCEPVPHKFESRSIYDKTEDVQRVKTVLRRQMLDNLYWVNNPMMASEADAVVNPQMMMAPEFGGWIQLKKGTLIPPAPLPIPFIGDKALMGLEHMDQVIEKRTGVSRATMALDPETLQNQTATANQNQRDAAYSQIELVAKNQARGWKRVFKQILRLIVKHQDRPRTIRLRDEWVDIDPRQWNADMDATVNVGLGTGSRDRDMQMLSVILRTQQEIAQGLMAAGFLDKALAMVPKVIKTATKLAESSGIRNPDEYYPPISEDDVKEMTLRANQQAAQGDPKIALEKAKVEMQMQLEQAKMQASVEKERAQMLADLQVKQAEMQAEMEREQQKLAFEREKLAIESQMKERELEQKMQIELLKINAQQRAKEQELGAQREMHGEKLAFDDRSQERQSHAKLQSEMLTRTGNRG